MTEDDLLRAGVAAHQFKLTRGWWRLNRYARLRARCTCGWKAPRGRWWHDMGPAMKDWQRHLPKEIHENPPNP